VTEVGQSCPAVSASVFWSNSSSAEIDLGKLLAMMMTKHPQMKVAMMNLLEPVMNLVKHLEL
jgi:hypothetical protein